MFFKKFHYFWKTNFLSLMFFYSPHYLSLCFLFNVSTYFLNWINFNTVLIKKKNGNKTHPHQYLASPTVLQIANWNFQNFPHWSKFSNYKNETSKIFLFRLNKLCPKYLKKGDGERYIFWERFNDTQAFFSKGS